MTSSWHRRTNNSDYNVIECDKSVTISLTPNQSAGHTHSLNTDSHRNTYILSHFNSTCLTFSHLSATGQHSLAEYQSEAVINAQFNQSINQFKSAINRHKPFIFKTLKRVKQQKIALSSSKSGPHKYGKKKFIYY